MLAVPQALLDILRWKPGTRVGIAIEGGRPVEELQKRRRYTLSKLLAACNPKERSIRKERGWLDSKPVAAS